jgi:hypothetical protein
MAGALIAALHSDVLRDLAQCTGQHFQGLRSAASFLRKQGLAGNLAKRLCRLDDACCVSRHITAVSACQFRQQLWEAARVMQVPTPMEQQKFVDVPPVESTSEQQKFADVPRVEIVEGMGPMAMTTKQQKFVDVPQVEVEEQMQAPMTRKRKKQQELRKPANVMQDPVQKQVQVPMPTKQPAGHAQLASGSAPGTGHAMVDPFPSGGCWERLPDDAWKQIHDRVCSSTLVSRRWNYIVSTLSYAISRTSSLQVGASTDWRSRNNTQPGREIHRIYRSYGLEHGMMDDVPLTRDEVDQLGWRRIPSVVWDRLSNEVRGGSRDPARLSRRFYDIALGLTIEDLP